MLLRRGRTVSYETWGAVLARLHSTRAVPLAL